MTNVDLIEASEDFYRSDDPKDLYNMVLKPELRERIEYKLINGKQWDYLQQKYGGVALRREKYRPEYYAFYQVEVYFQRINLTLLPARDNFEVEKISKEKAIFGSKRWTLRQLKDRIVSVLGLPRYGYNLKADNFRLWRLDATANYEAIVEELKKEVSKIRTAQIKNVKDGDVEDNVGIDFPGVCLDLYDKTKTLDKLNISPTDKIVLELANDKGEFIFRYTKNVKMQKCEFCYQERPMIVACKCKEVFYCSMACMKKDEKFHAEKCSAVGEDEDLTKYTKTDHSNMGRTGLQNLGNTCFMNSGLQCLSNTWLLSRYFLEDRYIPEINETNVLGLKGKMAKSYAKLMKLLWYDDSQFVSPWDLKRVIGKFHSAFAGFAQQDSQELISTVLDALHEDLNRVKEKPYVELKTTDNPEDNSVSVENWYSYLARNQSIVVDLAHGQYKSVVKCPKCAKYSVTFDPFSIISLPVPAPTERVIIFVYVPYNLAKKPVKCSLTLGKQATADELRQKIADLMGVPKYSSTLVMLSAKTFDRFVCADQAVKLISKMSTSHLYVQEINPKYFAGPENLGYETRKKAEASKPVPKDAEKTLEEKKPAQRDDGTEMQEITGQGQGHEQGCGPAPQLQAREEIKGQDEKKVTGKPKKVRVRDHDDYNNGLSDDMLRVCVSIMAMMKQQYWNSMYKERVTFNRLIYVKKSQTLRELHMEVFRYFRPLLELGLAKSKKPATTPTPIPTLTSTPPPPTTTPPTTGQQSVADGEGKKASDVVVDEAELARLKLMGDDELFAKVFPGLDEKNWPDKLKSPSEYPYELRFVNIADRSSFNHEKCLYCDKEDCDNCLVPFTAEQRVQDMLLKITKDPVKNDYFYTEHKYYNQNRREFELEIVLNQDKDKWVLDSEQLDTFEVHKNFSENLNGEGSKVSIYSCFDQFSDWETLDENNLWFCPKCKESVAAKKRMEILRSPPILILHLKRFKTKESSVMGMSSVGGRLNTLVDFPLENLDLTKYVPRNGKPAIYDLYAVSNHYGSIGFGHYTASGLNDGHWYKFDDSSVSRIDPSSVCSTASYVLFYKRKDITTTEDYEALRQRIPEGYKVPVIETKKKKPATTPGTAPLQPEAKKEGFAENAAKKTDSKLGPHSGDHVDDPDPR